MGVRELIILLLILAIVGVILRGLYVALRSRRGQIKISLEKNVPEYDLEELELRELPNGGARRVERSFAHVQQQNSRFGANGKLLAGASGRKPVQGSGARAAAAATAGAGAGMASVSASPAPGPAPIPRAMPEPEPELEPEETIPVLMNTVAEDEPPVLEDRVDETTAAAEEPEPEAQEFEEAGYEEESVEDLDEDLDEALAAAAEEQSADPEPEPEPELEPELEPEPLQPENQYEEDLISTLEDELDAELEGEEINDSHYRLAEEPEPVPEPAQKPVSIHSVNEQPEDAAAFDEAEESYEESYDESEEESYEEQSESEQHFGGLYASDSLTDEELFADDRADHLRRQELAEEPAESAPKRWLNWATSRLGAMTQRAEPEQSADYDDAEEPDDVLFSKPAPRQQPEPARQPEPPQQPAPVQQQPEPEPEPEPYQEPYQESYQEPEPQTRVAQASLWDEEELAPAEPAPARSSRQPAREPAKAKAEPAPRDNNNVAPDYSEVMIINITARQGEDFHGNDLLPVLLASGLRFGEMSIFHRHVDLDGKGPVLFSVANILNPGTFDLNQINDISTKGLCFFLTLPNVINNMQAFDKMLECARQICAALDGELKDDNRSVLTAQTIEHYRQRIRDFELQQLKHNR